MSYGQVPRQDPDLTRRQIDAFVAAVAENKRQADDRAEATREAERAGMSPIKRAWMTFLAWTRLSPEAVCLMSTERRDFHDWQDGHHGEPFHFATHFCKRCGRGFEI